MGVLAMGNRKSARYRAHQGLAAVTAVTASVRPGKGRFGSVEGGCQAVQGGDQFSFVEFAGQLGVNFVGVVLDRFFCVG